MRIDFLKPLLSNKELQAKYTQLQEIFPDMFLAPMDKGKYNAFIGRLPTGDVEEDQKRFNFWKEEEYKYISDIVVFPNQNIASVNNNFKIYDEERNNQLDELYKERKAVILQLRSDRGNQTLNNKISELRDEIKSQNEISSLKGEAHRTKLKEKLSEAGYDLAINHHRQDTYSDMGKTENAITELQAMWSMLKWKQHVLSQPLESLTNNILQDYSDKLDLVIYNPATDYEKESFDPVFAYHKYDKLMPEKRENLNYKVLNLVMMLSSHKAIGLSSKIGEQHYKQIDFKTKDYLEAKKTLESLGLTKGQIINSGNSYHYHDINDKLTQDNWHNFMDELKKYETIGALWPKLQQEQGFSMLRITPSHEKPYFPEKVE